jgi:hypothetical protein
MAASGRTRQTTGDRVDPFRLSRPGRRPKTVLDERGCVIVDAAGVLIVTARLPALCLQTSFQPAD